MRIRHRGKGSKMQQHHVHWVTNTTMSRWMQNTAKAPSLSPPHGTVWNGKGCCLSLQRWFRFFQPEEWASIKQSLITVLFICSFMLGWFLMRCRNLTNKCQHRRISDSHPLIQFEVRHRAFFSIWRKLASATALSSFMVRKIRCQTHLSQGPHSPPNPHPPISTSTCWLGMFSSSPRDLVFILGSSAAQSSYGFKALCCLLNHNTNCPSSGLNKRFLFFSFLFSVAEVPPVHMICLWGSLHLIKWAQPVSVGITHQSGKQR